VPLTGPWRFLGSDDLTGAEAPAFDDQAWETVEVPHTWALRDPRQHSHAWYRFRLKPDGREPGQRLFLLFEGVGAVADVYVNGKHLGQHRGAFTRFIFDATGALVPGHDNLVAVRVDNTAKDTADCLPSGPQNRHYFVDGGITRRVWLLRTAAVHIDPTDHASSGVYFVPGPITVRRADYAVKVVVRNSEGRARDVEVRAVLTDPEGRPVAEQATSRAISAAGSETVMLQARLDRPRLWGPGHPTLYTLHVELRIEGHAVDHVSQPVGFRTFTVEDGQFFLNHEPLLVRGVGKHEKVEARASAVLPSDIDEDFRVLADLGVNMVRLAHYPHSDRAYTLADQQGLLVWAENGNSAPGPVGPTGEQITREMVLQGFNHPSIVIWAVGNEADYRGVPRYTAIVREEDRSRLVTYSSNIGVRPRARRSLDFVAQNKYPGWYRHRDTPEDFLEIARQVRYLSETGAGSVVTHHCNTGREYMREDSFEPEEYRQVVSEIQFQAVFREAPREIPLYLLWVLRDFRVPEGRKYRGINTKGLLTGAGLAKDAYYLYRAFLRPETPTLYIADQTRYLRWGGPANAIKVYANSPYVTLTVNGQDRGRRRNGDYRNPRGQQIDNVFLWRGPLIPGRSEVTVRDAGGREQRAVFYQLPGQWTQWPEEPGALVRDLRSSNPKSRCHYINAPVHAQWPVYHEYDGTANNTFADIPAPLEGATWIATGRLSKPGKRTRLDFRIASDSRGADVWILHSRGSDVPPGWAAAGFVDSGTTGEWRNDDLRLVPLRALHRWYAAGAAVSIAAGTLDYVVLVRAGPQPAEGEAPATRHSN